MESPNDLIANLVFNTLHIVLVGFVSNNMEGEDVEVVEVAKHAIEEHFALKKQLKDLKRQCVVWKPHSCNSITWTSYQVNNNQPIDLTQNQTMCFIVYHHQIVGPKILALHIRTQKVLIAYHKSNGITIMKKHIEVEHNNFLKG